MKRRAAHCQRRTNTVLAALMSALVLSLTAGSAAAQISAATVNTSTFVGSPANSVDGSSTSSVAIQTNNGTTLATRFAMNVNADIGIGATRDQSGNASHRITFNATAPGGYRLTVGQTFTGDMNRFSDLVLCEGAANISGVTGSQTGGTLTTGTLQVADPGNLSNGGSTTSTPFSLAQNGAAAQIHANSNGAPVAHVLTFTWNAQTRSNSCEAAVRLGEQNGTTTGCTGTCVYPGSPSRNQPDDGHFVNITYASLCGNGVVDVVGPINEQCDQGGANGTAGSCCTSSCQFRGAGQECRGLAGACDQAEVCTGASGTCPADIFLGTGVICRAASAGMDCDEDEVCAGGTPNCPADGVKPNGTLCRASGGVCDPQEVCNGSSKLCPSDGKSTALCRGAAGVCDLAEFCDGVNNNCPTDIFKTSATPCRPGVDVCDQTENCPGGAPDCPADGVKPNGTSCTSDGNPCTVDQCDGVGTACTHPAGNAGATCRADTGECDVAELCDGSNSACPADDFEPSGTVCTDDGNPCSVDECDGANNCTHPAGNAGVECRAASVAEDCDEAELCDGSSTTCPVDAYKPSGTPCSSDSNVCTVDECNGLTFACQHPAGNAGVECRAASTGLDCDEAEQCDGSNTACPADSPKTAGFTCRADAGECDVEEQCDGIAFTCPVDGFEPSGTVCSTDGNVCTLDECDGAGACTHPAGNAGVECRADAGVCDVAEQCDGSNTACPVDGFELDGTGCDNSLFCDGADTCASGVCQSAGTPCGGGETCDEANNLCFSGGCPANAQICRDSQKAIVLVKDKADNNKDKLIFKYIKGDQTDQTEFANPQTSAPYAICLYAGPGAALIGGADVPPNATKWSPVGTKGYKYKDPAGAEDSITKVLLKGGAQDKTKVLVKGKGAGLPDLTLPITVGNLPLIVQVRNNSSGLCWGGTFNSLIRDGSTGTLKGKTP